MPQTTKWAINYPSGSEAPDIPAILQSTAESVDTALETLAGRIPWTPLTLVNGYLPYIGGGGYYSGLRASKQGNHIYISGMVKNPTSGDAATVIATLPVGLRPAFSVIITVATGKVGAPRVPGIATVSTDGAITYEYGVTDPTYVGFNIVIPIN